MCRSLSGTRGRDFDGRLVGCAEVGGEHLNNRECYGLNCVSLKRYVQILIPVNGDFFGNGFFADIIK